jgi:hypothetical protein
VLHCLLFRFVDRRIRTAFSSSYHVEMATPPALNRSDEEFFQTVIPEIESRVTLWVEHAIAAGYLHVRSRPHKEGALLMFTNHLGGTTVRTLKLTAIYRRSGRLRQPGDRIAEYAQQVALRDTRMIPWPVLRPGCHHQRPFSPLVNKRPHG